MHNSTLTENPSVRESTTDGRFIKQLPSATQEAGSPTTGIRDGEGLTGLTFSTNGLLAVATLGGPLFQDGPNPTATIGATNVTTVKSLSGATFTPVSKTLLLDFATLHLPGGVANYAGLTFGPTLPNGDKSLVLVSDNGFSTSVATHILALDVHGI